MRPVLSTCAWFAIAVLSMPACTGAPERTPKDAPLPASAAPGAPERNAAFATAEVPTPSRLTSVLPAYPKEVTGTPAGTVTLRITIDASGRVVDAVQPFVPNYSTRVIGERNYLVGRPLPRAFVESAVASVRQWQYAPPGDAVRSVYVQFSFSPGVATFVSWQDDQPPPAAGDGSVVNAGLTITGDRTVPLPPDTREPVRINGPVTAPQKTKDSGRNKVAIRGRRGARPARREERAYREYVSDEQRSPAGCIRWPRMATLFRPGS